MKVKPVYIYLAVFIAFVLALIIFTSNGEKTTQNNMPNDDVHKGLTNPHGNGGPSKSNLSDDYYKQLNELKAAYEQNPNDTVKIKAYADFLAASHQTDNAAELYTKILDKGPKRIDIMLELTFLYYEAGNYDKAEEYTNKILAIDKNQLEANYNLGALAAAKGDKDKAIQIWNNVIAKYPGTDAATNAQKSIEQLNAKK